MKRILTTIVLTVVIAMVGGSAYSKDSGPTREQAVRVLRELLVALETKNYDKAITFMQVPTGADQEKLKQQLARLIELQEISSRGIDILSRNGRWGKLDQVFERSRAKRFAERAGVALNASYGLTLKNAEAGFYW
ncbi:MAG: hypothetical protein WCH75_26240, partial [Candidatus Binatia bacterium]